MHGFNFVDSDSLHCRFGGNGVAVPARWISSSKVECVAPAHTKGSVAVEVTMNNADYTANGVAFDFVDDALLTSVTPTIGPSSGGTTLTLKGSGFVFSPHLQVRFGLHSVPATFVSSTEIKCVTQASEVGDASLSITNNGVDYSGASVKFTFRGDAQVHAIVPHGGSITGGTTIIATGSGFTNTSSLACLLYTSPSPRD